jgi:CHAT domain-containing protein
LNFDSVQNLFDKVQDKQFHVVHLICHGKFTYDSTGVLILEGANGQKQNIDPSVLARVLERVSPSLVILQACHSGDIDSSTDFVSGVAETLVRFGIPAVLAFRGKPNIDFAFEFLSKVYEKWLPGQVPIETAIQSARLAIRNSQTNSLVARPIDAWSLPVLYRQPGVFLQIVNKSGPGPRPVPTETPPSMKPS